MRRLLDLYCGAGGAGVGYKRAGFDEVVGVDIDPQPRYPFEFRMGDAIAALERALWYKRDGRRSADYDLDDFDAIHASPPCQAYSVLAKCRPDHEWPDLLAATRDLLVETGLPYVIENVPGSPIYGTLLMCGGGLLPVVKCEDGVERQLRRHRYFEVNWPIMGHPCVHEYEALGVYGTWGRWDKASTRRGGYQGDLAEKKLAMDIDWMTHAELNESIPPAYTEFIGRGLLDEVARRDPVAA